MNAVGRELNPDQFTMLAKLLAADYFLGEAVFTPAGLADAAGVTCGRDTILRNLKAMRPAWIDFELGERQRKPITFRLTGATVCRTSAANRPPSYRQSTDAVRQRDEVAKPALKPPPTTPRLSQGPSEPLLSNHNKDGTTENLRVTENKSTCPRCKKSFSTEWRLDPEKLRPGVEQVCDACFHRPRSFG